MAFDIKIYGDIVPSANGKQPAGTFSLVDLQKALEKANGDDIRVRINSFGGDVDEGFAIYNEIRRYAKEHGAHVTTLAEARCASIATIIFTAGDERIVSKFIQPFVHNAWTEVAGNANQLRESAKILDDADKMIARHYSEHTNLSYNEAIRLMGEDTSLTPEDCRALRFATQVEQVARPLAIQRILNKKLKPEINMSTNQKWKSDLKNFAKGILGISNKIVFDFENKEVDFYELGEDEEIIVGAKATVDGQPANGEILMQSGKTFVFDNGELTEIKDGQEIDEELENLRAENEVLKAEKAEIETEFDTAVNALAKLKEDFETVTKERNSLQAKVNNAQSKFTIDLKNRAPKDEPKEKESETSASVMAFRQAKFNQKIK